MSTATALELARISRLPAEVVANDRSAAIQAVREAEIRANSPRYRSACRPNRVERHDVEWDARKR